MSIIHPTSKQGSCPTVSSSSTDSSTSAAVTLEGLVGLMGHCDRSQQVAGGAIAGLDAHRDARSIVRLVQCSICSYPLKNPMTLPCGNSLCRNCLPELHARENISYPDRPGRQQGFICPFEDCGKQHSLADCSLDVTLTKVMDVVSHEIARCREITTDSPILVEENVDWSADQRPTLSQCEKPRSRVLHGGRLVAAYTFAEMGELSYHAGVTYQTMSENGDDFQYLDVAILEHLKEATRNELDCQVCYALMLDPLTTSCGHTFCRKCLVRVLDHSNNCPICRRTLSVPPSLSLEPSNKRLTELLIGLCPDLLAARAEQASREDESAIGELDTPLFVCTLSYPAMPTFLHIFEARYRLMIRRAVESGARKFGMLMYNQNGEPQGELGPTQFMEYGTLLHIQNVQMLPDGRSLIETIGVSRFRVKDWGMLDGYTVGSIERIEDVSLAEEERLEALEISSASPSSTDLLGQLDKLPTRTLLQIGIDYINRMRASSAPWLHERIIAAYGPPPEDPALFPYWFASVLPIADEQKYLLLPTRSVRERLKITARWVKRIEATHRCFEEILEASDPD